MMTRKNYRKMAKVIRDAKSNAILDRDEASIDRLRKVEDNLVSYLASDNPRFDEARFRAACDPYCI